MLLVAACSGPGVGSEDESFWESVRITGDEVDRYGSLTEMADRSDAVVVGRFGDVTGTRVVGGPGPQAVTYTQVDLLIDQVVRGRLSTPSVTVEQMVEVSPDQELPAGSMLVFLVDKAGREEGLWRPLNSRGLWTATERARIDTPLNEDVPTNDPLYADLVGRVDTIAELAAEL